MFIMILNLSNYIVAKLFGLSLDSTLGQSVSFFIYDSIKILLLIFLVVILISFVRTYFAPHKIRQVLSRQKWGIGNLFASILGAISPFCSCSSIPIFIGLLEAEVPASMAFSFLITSPLVNEVAFILMFGLFGWKVAITYAIFGIALGVIAGQIVGNITKPKDILIKPDQGNSNVFARQMPSRFKEKISYAFREGTRIFKNLWWIVLIGVAVGAIIHGYVPEEFLINTLHLDSIWSVPIATVVGIPIYAGCSTIVPIVFAVTTKGVSLGTALAFMMAVAGLSLPEAIILKKVMSWRLLGLFYLIVGLGIIAVGYLFNLFGI